MNKPELSQLLTLARYANPQLLPQRKRSNAVMSANHASGRLGRGMDFSEFRHYQTGDDVRSIDWSVTARTGKTHIRLYHEEKERPVFILVDQGESMRFGTQKKFKSVLAAEIAALLAWSALDNHDRVGGSVMGVADATLLSPRTGKSAVLNFLNLLTADHETLASESEELLKKIRPLVKSSSVICFISDFENFSEGVQTELEQLSKYNDLLCVHVSDPLEKNPPPSGQYLVSEKDQELLWDTEDLLARDEYQKYFEKKLGDVKDFCGRSGIAFWAVETTMDLSSPLPLAGEGLGVRAA